MAESAESAFFRAARPHRAMILACVIGATLLQVLDSTIANVALPHMQGSLSATTDQISWVLTSYLIAAAIVTPAIGWVAGRVGRRRVLMLSMAGFTIVSMLCGAAQSLNQMVFFRLLQGVFGASLMPLAQTVILDMYQPRERSGAVALWTLGVMVGPILGPTVGAWLTESYNWRYVFYVNLPVGVLGWLGMWLFLPESPRDKTRQFDWTGFFGLSLGIGGLQLVLDRGESKDWFDSMEVTLEAIVAGLGLYVFALQMWLARNTFVNRKIFKDRNFTVSVVLQFCFGIAMNGVSALLPAYFQGLANYPVLLSGIAMIPRAMGTVLLTPLVARLINRVDARALMLFGMVVLALTMWRMAYWTPDMGLASQLTVLLAQGGAIAFMFAPLQVLAFATLPPTLRAEASGILALCRNFGASVGVSILETLLARESQVSHADLARFATPFNRALQSGPAAQAWGLGQPGRLIALDQVISGQAMIIAYADDFMAIGFAVALICTLILLMRAPPRLPSAKTEIHVAE